MKAARRKLRDAGEIEEAVARLSPLAGDPVVDAVIAALRWTLREAEWSEAFGELARRYGSAGDGREGR